MLEDCISGIVGHVGDSSVCSGIGRVEVVVCHDMALSGLELHAFASVLCVCVCVCCRMASP
jgi:hypothetical protein